MKIIFLDIDGVLNSGRSFIAFGKQTHSWEGDDPYYVKITKVTIDPVSVGLLNRVLKDFDAKIVLSSTHRMHFPDDDEKLQRIQNYLTFLGVEGKRCIGYTPRFNTIRGVEIKYWIENNPEIGITHMIILDDSSDFLPEQMEFHVHCKGGHGITEENYRQMTRMFGMEDSGLVLL
jgi:hypothetical protein